jgi:hypothetical protein
MKIYPNLSGAFCHHEGILQYKNLVTSEILE